MSDVDLPLDKATVQANLDESRSWSKSWQARKGKAQDDAHWRLHRADQINNTRLKTRIWPPPQERR
jgi:hypothetical protein